MSLEVALVQLIAVGLIVFQLRASRATMKSQHTFQNIFTGDALRLQLEAITALRKIIPHFHGRHQITPSEAREILGRKDIRVAVRNYLNHYEAIAAGIYRGGLDARYMRQYRGTGMRHIVWTYWYYIKEARLESNEEWIYNDLVKLAEDWDVSSTKIKFFDKLGNVIIDRNYVNLPRKVKRNLVPFRATIQRYVRKKYSSKWPQISR